jgi:DNA-binding transcriptional MerR regulator
MKVGEVAALLGVSTRTLRYYEEEGLLTPKRTEGGTRMYTTEQVSRLRMILALVACNVPLSAVRTLATVRQASTTGDESSHQVCHILGGLMAQLEQQMTQLQHVADEIRGAIPKVEHCFGCQNPPTDVGCPECPLPKSRDKHQLLRLIWE